MDGNLVDLTRLLVIRSEIVRLSLGNDHPETAQASLTLAQVYLEDRGLPEVALGHAKEAHTVSKRALKAGFREGHEKLETGIRYIMGCCHASLGDEKLAASNLSKALKADPGDDTGSA